MHCLCRRAALLVMVGVAACATRPAPAQVTARPVFRLRYRFAPGEMLRWNVEHRATVRTTISGNSQTADTTSRSVKVWKVSDVQSNRTTFEQSVESVEMRQKLTGRQEITYNSRTDSQPPVEFADVAKAVGVPLKRITLDLRGSVIERKDLRPQAGESTDVQVTIPFPEEAIPVGHVWKVPYDMQVADEQVTKTIRTQQRFELESVENGVATILIETQILTPIDDPKIEAQVVQRETRGQVRFDVDAGRVISQEMNLDKQVVGFSGPSSSMHYQTRFTEELIREAATAAGRSRRKS